ncbi:MAG: pectin esterase [Armatimonadetes bacterium]|nr:pectin esterase [Armatimonadota bacterium]
MKKPLFLVSLIGLCLLGWSRDSQPEALSKAQTAPRAENRAAKSRVWPAHSDGFASVVTPEQAGTTGGAGGKVVTVESLADLEKYAAAPEPMVILIKGAIRKEPFGKEIKIASHKTLLGLGSDAAIVHGELSLKGVSNVIVRNLTIRDSWVAADASAKSRDFDAFQIDDSHHIWIDHCNLTRMEDGLIDFRKASDYLTVSWSILSHHNKAFGIGWNPQADKLRVAIHHTWIHDTGQRNPSLDNGTGHLYNNWLQNVSSYGNYSRGRAKVVVENSVFERVNNPLHCGPEAEMVSRGNIFQNCTVSDGEKAALRGAAFDPRNFYAYQLDDAADVPALLRAHAGPQTDIGTPEMAARMAQHGALKPAGLNSRQTGT